MIVLKGLCVKMYYRPVDDLVKLFNSNFYVKESQSK